jgi:hypothetical protein
MYEQEEHRTESWRKECPRNQAQENQRVIVVSSVVKISREAIQKLHDHTSTFPTVGINISADRK